VPIKTIRNLSIIQNVVDHNNDFPFLGGSSGRAMASANGAQVWDAQAAGEGLAEPRVR